MALLAAFLGAATVSGSPGRSPATSPAPASPDGTIGNALCAACHPAIAKSFSTHPMARSSGVLGRLGSATAPAGVFDDAPSGVRFDLAPLSDGRLSIEYRRPGGPRPLVGHVEASFVIGVRKGLSFLYSRDGYLYQAPVSYYPAEGRWNVSPGYEDRPYLQLARPVSTGCLECHASRLRPVSGTVNRYEDPPFLENGVGCERCHGPGAAHRDWVLGGKGPGGPAIVNPARLEPERRDSICAQCHLRGAARVVRKGCGLSEYRPGDRIGDVLQAYVWDGESGPLDATSHYQKLRESTCKQRAGDRLWCVSCHDPHAPVAPADRASYYRARCEKCHQEGACRTAASERAARQNDCVTCHMPKQTNETIAHAVATDHTIPRRPRPAVVATEGPPPLRARTLVPFWGGAAATTNRDLGLAYASLGDTRDREQGYELLRRAYSEGARDPSTLVVLASALDAGGDAAKALPLYQEALARGGGCPEEATEAENRVGFMLGARGRLEEALRLFDEALFRSPVNEGARVNRALVSDMAGHPAAADEAFARGLDLEPDSPSILEMRAQLLASRQR